MTRRTKAVHERFMAKVPMTVRLSEEAYAVLQRLASDQRRSFSQMFDWLLIQEAKRAYPVQSSEAAE